MERPKDLEEAVDLSTVESVGKYVTRLAHESQASLDPQPVEKFREKILGNTLPTPEETEELIRAATDLGRYETLRDLSRLITER